MSSATATAHDIISESLGCRLNSLERDHMVRLARQAGLDKLAIINSCAVTQEAVRQTHQLVRKMQRQSPERTIIVTGCAVDALKEDFGKDIRILPNHAKLQPLAWQGFHKDAAFTEPDALKTEAPQFATPQHGAIPQSALSLASTQTRGFLQIQNGCNHRCTFCIIPMGRGASQSRPLEEVIASATSLIDGGMRELVLTGVDLTAYHCPQSNQGLGTLVKALLTRLPKLARLRLSSLDCIEIDADLLDVIKHEPRFMPYLHLSVQAGDDLILKRMKRRHNRQDIIALCNTIRTHRPDMVFGADIIAGFPTESAAMFENTCRLFDDCGLTMAHVFPFSPRPNTPAARMPQLDPALIHARADQLRALSAKHKQRHDRSKIGAVEEILLEKGHKGYTRDYTKVRLEGAGLDNLARGALVLVKIMRHDKDGLWGCVDLPSPDMPATNTPRL